MYRVGWYKSCGRPQGKPELQNQKRHPACKERKAFVGPRITICVANFMVPANQSKMQLTGKELGNTAYILKNNGIVCLTVCLFQPSPMDPKRFENIQSNVQQCIKNFLTSSQFSPSLPNVHDFCTLNVWSDLSITKPRFVRNAASLPTMSPETRVLNFITGSIGATQPMEIMSKSKAMTCHQNMTNITSLELTEHSPWK